jgi:5'-nucleotidase (lipoprotein e(P4) family)
MVDDRHLLLQKAHEGKEPNRQSVAQQYHVVLLMGDNLDDFSDIFDRYDIKDRFDITDANRDQFGRRFIVLPNPMYGDWETTIYSRQKLTEAQKAAVRWQLVQQLNPSK